MPERLSGPSRREARLVTTGCAVFSGACLAAAVSPAIEHGLNWAAAVVLVVAGIWLVVRVARSVWLSLAIDAECRQSLRDNARMVAEVNRRA